MTAPSRRQHSLIPRAAGLENEQFPRLRGGPTADSANAKTAASLSSEPKARAAQGSSKAPEVQTLPTGKGISLDVLGLLVNMHAGERLAEAGTPTGLRLVRPVAPVDPIERVLIDPLKIDREAALRLIHGRRTRTGSAVRANSLTASRRRPNGRSWPTGARCGGSAANDCAAGC